MTLSSEARAAPAYRNRRASGLDKSLFIIVALGGAFGIVVAKHQGVSPAWVMTGALGIMLVYAGLLGLSVRYRLRDDRAGDNLYYLGFLYTLASLGYALWAFSGDEEGTEQIIANFGLALATTIAGLALRILFTQMREDPVEIEREARRDLAEATSRLKAELDTSVIELSSFRRATAQSLAEGMEEMAGKSAEILTAQGDRMTALVEKLVVKLDEGFSALGKDRKDLKEASRNTVKAVERLVERVEAINIPSDLFEAKLTPMVDGMAAAGAGIAAVSRAQAENAGQLTQMIETAVGAARLLDERVQALAQVAASGRDGLAGEVARLQATAGAVEGAMAESLKVLQESVAQQAQVLKGLAETGATQLQLATAHRSALEEEVAKSRALTAEIHQALLSLATVTIEKLNER